LYAIKFITRGIDKNDFQHGHHRTIEILVHIGMFQKE